jgi:hypothetical protein
MSWQWNNVRAALGDATVPGAIANPQKRPYMQRIRDLACLAVSLSSQRAFLKNTQNPD